ncbi:MAG TPA: aminotransferase class I/II-fold pyridoxal phosphate-dependent enzyme [Planctomycetia bacterium]|nr:aminotransferase class I/II-fold pyridoxal phosphate-dependent enzyme [Planctomycetia bacterium]
MLAAPERTLTPPPPCFHGGAFFEAIGVDFQKLERRREVINADVLDAWFPPAPKVISTIEEHLPWLLRTSPPTDCAGLLAAIAAARRLPRDCIAPGAGSSDLIYRAFRQWLRPDSRVLLLDPTYGEYAHVCREAVRCKVERFPLRRADGFAIDLDAWFAAAAKADLAVIVNPNNPTGRHLPRTELEAALAALPTRTRVWVDEAYLEYVGQSESLERFAVATPNVVVCKSLSKVYALSGARAAYLAANAKTVRELSRWTPPWCVGLPAQVAAVAALADPDYYAARYRETRAFRESLARSLRALDPRIEIVPGCANFVLCFLPDDWPTAAEIVARCRNRDVFFRDPARMGSSLGPRALRFAVKDEATQSRMLKEFAAAARI